MKKKQLERHFLTYQSEKGAPVSDNGPSAVLYSREEFHINKKQGTLYIEGIGVVALPELAPNADQADWLALWQKNGIELDMALGVGNPFTEQYMEILPNNNGMIIAFPKSLLKKFMKKGVANES